MNSRYAPHAGDEVVGSAFIDEQLGAGLTPTNQLVWRGHLPVDMVMGGVKRGVRLWWWCGDHCQRTPRDQVSWVQRWLVIWREYPYVLVPVYRAILRTLAESGGEIVDSAGRATSPLIDVAEPHSPSRRTAIQHVGMLDYRRGWIERDTQGTRCYAVRLTEAGWRRWEWEYDMAARTGSDDSGTQGDRNPQS